LPPGAGAWPVVRSAYRRTMQGLARLLFERSLVKPSTA
jgi:hypothetical protein